MSPMNNRLMRPRASGGATDADARAYIQAVQTADGQALEPAIVKAIDDFVIGCKADGIWSAIKASCILSGARTLSGALTPLVGTAPTNVSNNFVSGDYDRKTGLVGDGSTKSIDVNRNSNEDPQNSFHISAYVSSQATSGDYYIGDQFGTGSWTAIFRFGANTTIGFANRRQALHTVSSSATGLYGSSRSASGEFIRRIGGSNATVSHVSETRNSRKFRVFANGGTPAGEFGNPRIAFYSIGESLKSGDDGTGLATLDTRVTNLINAIAAAI